MSARIIGAVACIILMILGCTDSIKAPRINYLIATLGAFGCVALAVVV